MQENYETLISLGKDSLSCHLGLGGLERLDWMVSC